MLLVLDSTTRTLRAKMASAPSSVQCSVTVTYADTTATTFTEGMYPIQMDGTNFVTILPAPASGTRRVVKSVMFFNDDMMTHTVTLYLTDNITDYPITKITLPAGASWASDDQTGVNVGGAVTDGSKGDIVVSGGGDTWSIATGITGQGGAVTLAKMANLATDKLIGRDTAGDGAPEAIGVTGGIEFNGAGSIRVGAFSGDVGKTAGATTLTITDAAVTPAKLSATAQALSFRNKLINGDMRITQRGTSATGLTGTTAYNTADRWGLRASSCGTWTQAVVSTASDYPSATAFRRSLKMTCTTANTLQAGDFCFIQQRLEGQDLLNVLKGTTGALQLTLSFWVKAGIAGTYIAELHDNDNARYVSAAYSISAIDTWQQQKITFPADTTGAFDNDNAWSLAVNFWLGAGSTYTGGGSLQSTWGTSATSNRAFEQTQVPAGNAAGTNYWQITGVQLEVGSVATEFEYIPINVSRDRCFRYYYEVGRHVTGTVTSLMPFAYQNSTQAEYVYIYPTPMRAAPTGFSTSGDSYYGIYSNADVDFIDRVYFAQLTDKNCLVFEGAVIDGGGGKASGTAGTAGRLFIVAGSPSGVAVGFDAEL